MQKCHNGQVIQSIWTGLIFPSFEEKFQQHWSGKCAISYFTNLSIILIFYTHKFDTYSAAQLLKIILPLVSDFIITIDIFNFIG